MCILLDKIRPNLYTCRMNFIGVFDAVEIIIAILLTFAVSVTLSIGRSVTCSSYKKVYDT